MTIDEAFKKIDDFVSTVPKLVGNEAVNFFKDNFQKQGWQGQTFQPWKERKKETKRSLGKPILYQSGALERSIQVKSANENSTTVGTDGHIPYARIHNEGGQIHHAARSETFVRNRYKRGGNKGKFKKGIETHGRASQQGFTFKESTTIMPQRQFMGDSPILRDRVKTMIINEFKKTFSS